MSDPSRLEQAGSDWQGGRAETKLAFKRFTDSLVAEFDAVIDEFDPAAVLACIRELRSLLGQEERPIENLPWIFRERKAITLWQRLDELERTVLGTHAAWGEGMDITLDYLGSEVEDKPADDEEDPPSSPETRP